jgi:hypothetical protein
MQSEIQFEPTEPIDYCQVFSPHDHSPAELPGKFTTIMTTLATFETSTPFETSTEAKANQLPSIQAALSKFTLSPK